MNRHFWQSERRRISLYGEQAAVPLAGRTALKLTQADVREARADFKVGQLWLEVNDETLDQLSNSENPDALAVREALKHILGGQTDTQRLESFVGEL